MKFIDKRIVILLTATITPNSFDTLALTNPEDRRKQYIDALNFYLQHTDYSLVFVENSGESLRTYFTSDKNRIEFITFTSLPLPVDKGKGYKELEIMNFALSHSESFKQAYAIVKVTGRLKVLNIKKVIDDFLKSYHNQSIVSCNIYRTKKMDSRCFLFTIEFWPYLKERGTYINLKYSFESALWDAIESFQLVKENDYRFFCSPLKIEGVSGGFGTPYKSSAFVMFYKNLIHFYRTQINNRNVFRT